MDAPIFGEVVIPANNLNNSNQIMLSYSHNSRETARKICVYLRNAGYRVCIDIENLDRDILKYMAQSIKESCVIIIFMTETYAQSRYCQMEATYAVELSKPIVPIILEQGYQPTGWLGIITNGRPCINFTENDFELNCQNLVQQIQQAMH